MSSSLIINPRKTQMVHPGTSFDATKIVFGNPRIMCIKDMGKVKYMQIPIGYRNADNTIGELCLMTEKLFSFGISPPFQNLPTAPYTLSLSLYDKLDPTPEQKTFTNNVKSILSTARAFLESMKSHPDLEANNLKITTDRLDTFESSPIKWTKLCKDTKRRVDISPLMNVKLIVKMVDNDQGHPEEILSTNLVDIKNNPIQLHEFINKYCYAQCVIKFDGLFIGGMLITLQLKIEQGVLDPISEEKRPQFPIPMLETLKPYDNTPSIHASSLSGTNLDFNRNDNDTNSIPDDLSNIVLSDDDDDDME